MMKTWEVKFKGFYAAGAKVIVVRAVDAMSAEWAAKAEAPGWHCIESCTRIA